jgi:hypothetical protein
MKISNSHQKFADRLKDQTALEYPEYFLGPNWKDVLNFWIYLDTLSREDFQIVVDRYYMTKAFASWNASLEAAKTTISLRYINAVGTAWAGVNYATLELIASHNLESLKFLPLFLNL